MLFALMLASVVWVILGVVKDGTAKIVEGFGLG